MTYYFFDFRLDSTFAEDDEGLELRDVEAAHKEAMEALADFTRDAVIEGSLGRRFTIEVRDNVGQVLEVSAIYGSKIFRTH